MVVPLAAEDAGKSRGRGGVNLYSLTRDDHRPKQKNARTN